MSATDRSDGPPADRQPLPEFRLDYLVDDEDDPGRFTIVPEAGTVGSRWITVDADSAVPLDAVR